MWCVPAPSVLQNPTAWPVVGSIATVPMAVAPSLKVTVPVVAPPATVAVIARSCPWAIGFADAASVVVVLTLLPTVSVNTLDVLVAKPLAPPYTAVMECDPDVSEAVKATATPVVGLTATEPMSDEPSKNVMVPVGWVLPVLAVTVAVSATT